MCVCACACACASMCGRTCARVRIVKVYVLLILSFTGILICFLYIWSRCRLNLN